mmetsp:Transcript_29603/g.62780  ORF Transcript_29603/g.62780 Transcript_29603/m.62780 type:complete len:83 (+) Transcript_29603:161-409(+)
MLSQFTHGHALTAATKMVPGNTAAKVTAIALTHHWRDECLPCQKAISSQSYSGVSQNLTSNVAIMIEVTPKKHPTPLHATDV